MTIFGIPETTHEELAKALATFDTEYRDSDHWAGWQDRGQYKYAISHGGRLYPVKMVIELATGIDRRVIYGGTQANGYVKHYGFTVVQLRDLSSPWDAFVHWAKRFVDRFEHERAYKMRIAANLRQARAALLSGSREPSHATSTVLLSWMNSASRRRCVG